MGVTLSGVDAIVESTREGLAGFLRDEHLDDDHVMKVLYVVVKQDERWWTVARHHTLVC